MLRRTSGDLRVDLRGHEAGEGGQPGVDTRVTGLRATLSPGSDTCQDAPDEQGTAAVALAGVYAAGCVSGANHVARDEVGAVGTGTAGVGHDRHGRGPQLVGGAAALRGGAPADDAGRGAGRV